MQRVKSAFRSAARFLHGKGKYTPEMLTEDPVRELLFATSDSFSDAVNLGLKKTDLPASMRLYLQDNTFRFAGFKTHREMQAASRLLLDDEGNLKPFNRFLNDVQTIDKTYNGSYLQAEYNFAVASAQSAASWQDFVKDGDSFYLRYHTAGDERVRESHHLLDGITLPPTDPFWNEFFPPNDWNCRCTVIQVSKSKAEPSNSSEAIARGRSATYRPNSKGENKAQIFRFNPGKQKVIFPPKHPYLPKNCGDCKYRKLAYDKNKPDCQVCKYHNDISDSLSEFLKLSTKYELTRFDFHSGGFIATHPRHQFSNTKHKSSITGNKTKYSGGEVEKIVANLLCDKGWKIRLEKENKTSKSADIFCNGETWDVKYCNTTNISTIRKTISNAAEKADNVIFFSDSTHPKRFIKRAVSIQNKNNKLSTKVYWMSSDGNMEEIKSGA